MSETLTPRADLNLWGKTYHWHRNGGRLVLASGKREDCDACD